MDLSQIALVRKVVGLTTATVAATPENLHAGAGVSIQTDQVLISLGRERIVAPNVMAGLRAARNRLERAIVRRSVPMRAFDGHAVPVDCLGELSVELDAIVAEGNALINDLLANWTNHVAEFAKAHPRWAGVIRQRAPTESDLRQRLTFGYSIAHLVPAKGFEAGFDRDVLEVLTQLLREAKKMAENLDKKAFLGKSEVKPAVLDKLESLAKKIGSFSLIDHRLKGLADLIMQAVEPARALNGPITGTERTMLYAVVQALCDPDAIMGLLEHFEDTSGDLMSLLGGLGTMPMPAFVASSGDDDQSTDAQTAVDAATLACGTHDSAGLEPAVDASDEECVLDALFAGFGQPAGGVAA